MEHSSVLNKLLILFEWITRLVSVNIWWFAMSLPVLFLVLNMLLAQTVEQVINLTFTLMFVAPFIIFPSSFALISVAATWRGDDSELYNFRSFFKKYIANYKKSVGIGFFIETVIISLVFLISIFSLPESFKLTAVWVNSIFFMLVVLLVFISMATSSMSMKKHFKNICLIMMSFPFSYFLMGLFIQSIIIFSILYAQFFILFFIMSTVCYLLIVKYEKDVERVMRKKKSLINEDLPV